MDFVGSSARPVDLLQSNYHLVRTDVNCHTIVFKNLQYCFLLVFLKNVSVNTSSTLLFTYFIAFAERLRRYVKAKAPCWSGSNCPLPAPDITPQVYVYIMRVIITSAPPTSSINGTFPVSCRTPVSCKDRWAPRLNGGPGPWPQLPRFAFIKRQEDLHGPRCPSQRAAQLLQPVSFI